MDFFEQQDIARRRTGRLVVLMGLAVVAIMVLVYLVVATAVVSVTHYQSATATRGQVATDGGQVNFFEPHLLIFVGVGTVVLVLCGSLYKMATLRGGGRVIAESLGGRLIDTGSADATERKVLNVVEEMAIASGTPVPPVYLLEKEAGINAFAAGYTPSDAVIGVTRGCAELLSRDELQGVVAHEFSHILNGDMRLSIRLIGVIHGILVIGLLGGTLLRSVFYANVGRRRSSKEGGGTIAIIGVGIALMIIGYVGVFFGQLIKASVSRHREYLADAAAVQFTRLPEGITGALKKIGGYSFKSKIISPNAEETSHMFFGEGISHLLGPMMATHPPLAERIQRIEPGWDGNFPHLEPTKKTKQKITRKHSQLSRTLAGASGMVEVAAISAISGVGQPTPAHVDYASKLIAQLPEAVRNAAHEAYGARSLIYALLLDGDKQVRKRQYEQLREHADPQVYSLTQDLAPVVDALECKARLPVIDMAIAALRELSPKQYAAFKQNVRHLIAADEKVDLFEWVLGRIIAHHLEPQFGPVTRHRVKYYSLKTLARPCSVLLSVLAYAGHRQHDQVEQAFALGARPLELSNVALQPLSSCNLQALDKALDTLAEAGPRQKRTILTACAHCIAADRKVTVNESELLRGIADTLECPMPPLLPGQPLA